MALTGWGRTAPSVAVVRSAATLADIASAVRGSGRRGVLARGLGRSYGDAAQNAGGTVVDMTGLDRIGALDDTTGTITCEAGVSIDALLRQVVPRGWFVPVTPGTRQVSLGGALAADVHGKNHHRNGSIASHISQLELIDGSGELRILTPHDDEFWAVPGGMGLSGVITAVTLQLIPITSAWMTVTTSRTRDLGETLDALQAADLSARYSVAWVDCLVHGSQLGRGVITSGDHSPVSDVPPKHRTEPLQFQPRARLAAPTWMPPGLLNAITVSVFNEGYFRAAPHTPRVHQQHAAAYFHPLDAIQDWNRMYGRPGFLQYQFVTPEAADVEWAIARLRDAGAASFLAVLKRFGPGNRAPLSFPDAGWTLAVDIPITTRGLNDLLDRLDDRVVQSGGRVYLAKDSRLRADSFAAMYPDLDRWRELRSRTDPRGVFSSDLSRRLAL